MHITTIFGSNVGDKRGLIRKAVALLSKQAGEPIRISSFYETEPWGFTCDEKFLNQVVIFDTPLTPGEFLNYCLQTEKQLGRQRNLQAPRYSSRPIDIDLLFCDSLVVETRSLVLPHPRIRERNFVLTPLAEIMPEFIHPVFHKTIIELLQECPDQLEVKKINVSD